MPREISKMPPSGGRLSSKMNFPQNNAGSSLTMENLPRTVVWSHPQVSAPINDHIPKAHDVQAIWRQLFAQQQARGLWRKKICTIYVPVGTSLHDYRRRYVCFCNVGWRAHVYTLHRLNWAVPSGSLWRYELHLRRLFYTLNAILLRTVKSREDASMVLAFQSVHAELKKKGCKPNFHILDNQCSSTVQKFIAFQNVPIQIVAPNDHKVNQANQRWNPPSTMSSHPLWPRMSTVTASVHIQCCPLSHQQSMWDN